MPELIAYWEPTAAPVEIVPAPRWRDWMNETSKRFANRCLPLLVANEAGWALLNPVAFTATWNGTDSTYGVKLEFDEIVSRRAPVTSTFGYGIVTWGVPILFRTSPGFNLLARGPVNLPKDGASALEGIVETDWTPATFTMNWKLTRPNHPVRFEAGEPFCFLLPQRRGELESFAPRLVDRDTASDVTAENAAWRARRDELQKRHFIAGHIGPEAAGWGEWEGSYFRGVQEDGEPFPEHQTKLRLRAFEDLRRDGPRAPSRFEAPTEDEPACYRVADHVDFRAFQNETVLLDLERKLCIELNPVAGRMLDLIARTRSPAATARVIAAEYDQPMDAVRRDVDGFCRDLLDRGVLVEV